MSRCNDRFDPLFICKTLNDEERSRIFRGNATDFYRLREHAQLA